MALAAALTGLFWPAGAQAADWIVRAQANGSANDSDYSYCGSSDGQVNCASADHASGSVLYSNGGTRIKAQGRAQGKTHPESVASGHVVADLGSVTIRQSNQNMFGSSGTAGLLKDQLTFTLSDPGAVYAIPFSYSFEGTLSGDSSNGNHPGLYAQSYFGLGSASIASTQSIGESGPDYYPPSVSLNNGSGDWTDVVVQQSAYGYSISGKLMVGGGWGKTLGFDMQSQVSCANVYGAARCDFGHTQKFDFGSLPTGVSYSSASGVFLTTSAAVPEPSSWALMLGGIGLVGGTLRARRRIAASSA